MVINTVKKADTSEKLASTKKVSSLVSAVGLSILLTLSHTNTSQADFWSEARDHTIGKDGLGIRTKDLKISKNDIDDTFKKVRDNTVGKNGIGALGTKIHDETERFYERIGTETKGIGRVIEQAGDDIGNGLTEINQNIIEPVTEFTGDIIQELGIKPLKLTMKEFLRFRCRLESGRRSDTKKDKDGDGLNDDYMACWYEGAEVSYTTGGQGGGTITYKDPGLPGPISISPESPQERKQREKEYSDYVKTSNDTMNEFLQDMDTSDEVYFDLGSGLPDDFFSIPTIEKDAITRDGKITIEGIVYPSVTDYQLLKIDNEIASVEESILQLSSKSKPSNEAVHVISIMGAASLVKAGLLADVFAGIPLKSVVGVGKVGKIIIISTKFSKTTTLKLYPPTNAEDAYYEAMRIVAKDVITPEFTKASVKLLIYVNESQQEAKKNQRTLRIQEERLEKLEQEKKKLQDYKKENPLEPMNLDSLIGTPTKEPIPKKKRKTTGGGGGGGGGMNRDKGQEVLK